MYYILKSAITLYLIMFDIILTHHFLYYYISISNVSNIPQSIIVSLEQLVNCISKFFKFLLQFLNAPHGLLFVPTTFHVSLKVFHFIFKQDFSLKSIIICIHILLRVIHAVIYTDTIRATNSTTIIYQIIITVLFPTGAGGIIIHSVMFLN